MGTSKLRVTGINHVVLHVADLDRSRRFYMELLGFTDRGIADLPVALRASTYSRELVAMSTAARR